MASLRRKLRVIATTWLVLQVVWLTALVPRDCCAAHRPAEKSHASPAATYCPMPDADGRPCPMHRGAAAQAAAQSAHGEHHHGAANAGHHGTPSQSPDCRLSAACDGPMAALFTLLSGHGILLEPSFVPPNAGVRHVAAVAHESVIGQLDPPDPPPPRA